jgi:predicted dehydrogenase
MNGPTRVGVVGCGHMGKYHVGAYMETMRVEIAGVADPKVDEVRPLAERFEIPLYADYRDLFDKVDAVSIAVPTRLHFEVAREFLERGIHVLLEKPIAPDYAQAEELFRVARSGGAILHVGHVERFNGAVQEIQKIIDRPLLIECRRIGPYAKRIIDDGVVLDVMIHDLDILLNLVDSPVVEIAAMGRSVITPKEDFVSAALRFENGCVATVLASRISEEKIRTLTVHQRGAYVLLDYADQEIHIHRQATSDSVLTREHLRYRQESLIERIFVHKGNPLKGEIEHFLKCVAGGRCADEVGRELRSLEVALEILAQLRAKGEISY